MARFSGPIAGGPWHGGNMDGENPTIECPILPPASILTSPLNSVLEIGGIQAARYRWNGTAKMWVWEGPNVPIRR